MIFLIPNTISQETEIEWTESFRFEGTCGLENVRNRIQVNRTVVDIAVNLTWTTEYSYADLDFWIEDSEGNFVDTAATSQMPEQMIIKRLPSRGRWSIVITKKACGSCPSADFTMNVSLRNIALPKLILPDEKIEPDEKINLSVNSSYPDIYQYFFDFGDGTDSGWINHSFVSKEYNKTGEYTPKAKVRYSDGAESDWVEAREIKVAIEEEDQICLWIFIWMGILTGIIFLGTYIHTRKEEG
jgi:hypothetical protein